MPDSPPEQFIHSLDIKLWSVDDRLRAVLDAAVHEHTVLWRIFLKYFSDLLAMQQRVIEARFCDPKSGSFPKMVDYGDVASAKFIEAIRPECEAHDYCGEKSVF